MFNTLLWRRDISQIKFDRGFERESKLFIVEQRIVRDGIKSIYRSVVVRSRTSSRRFSSEIFGSDGESPRAKIFELKTDDRVFSRSVILRFRKDPPL